jgi:hypothetical protein
MAGLTFGRLRRSLAGLPLPPAADGRLILAVDVSNWLRPGAATSPGRLFCHVYGRGKGQAQMIPGWPYSVVAALESGRTPRPAVLDAVRLGPDDDEAAVTAAQVRDLITRLIEAGHWHDGDPPVLVVFDAGYDVTRLSFLLADLPVEVLGRLRSDRVMRLSAPSRQPHIVGRPRKRGGELALARLGNQVGVIPVKVPTSGRPLDRLGLIAEVTRQHKTGTRGASAALLAPVFRVLAMLGVLRWLIERQHLVTTFVTNLRGPDTPVSFLGSIVSEVVPLNAVTGNVALAFAVLSYAGALTVTVTADVDAVPDSEVLVDALQDELDALTHRVNT